MKQHDYRRIAMLIARKTKNLTLRELAGHVGVSHTILSRLERDYRRTTDVAVKAAICRELELPEFPEGPGTDREGAVVP